MPDSTSWFTSASCQTAGAIMKVASVKCMHGSQTAGWVDLEYDYESAFLTNIWHNSDAGGQGAISENTAQPG